MIATKNHQGLSGQRFAGGITLMNKNSWPRFGAELGLKRMSYLDLFNAVSAEAIRTITGRLFTDAQIRQVVTHAVGKYFADLLPEPADERAARERVEEARNHIEQASTIISQLQSELGSQTQQLDRVLAEIEEKKRLAMKYEALAKTGQEQFAAFKSEMEGALRQELTAQSEKGKTVRRFASGFFWLVTLLLGAALGTYFKDLLEWLRALAP
jgi:ATP-dependent Lon protease